MSPPRRFFFDECVPRPLMEQLHTAVASSFEFCHLCEMLSSGTTDQVWVKMLCQTGGYVVVTADAGKQSRKSNKLPDICRAMNVTHLVMSAKFHSEPLSSRLGALINLWPTISILHDEPIGSRWDIRYQSVGGKGSGNSVRLKIVRVQ